MKKQFFYYFALLTLFILPLQAWDWVEPFEGIKTDFRVAYYHPSSHRVRRIYGSGWADYQLELSKPFGCYWRIWTGVSGFSRKGESIGLHHPTRLQLIPLSLGVKYEYPLGCYAKLFVGGAACYSFLRIHDHSRYVHQHFHKENWGGLIQSGLSYAFCDWGEVSLFADYFFQSFHFHENHGYSCSGHFVHRFNLNMSGYKVGVGLGLTF